jgi:hypothetical protein
MLQGHYMMYSTTAKKEIIFFVFPWYLAGTIWCISCEKEENTI